MCDLGTTLRFHMLYAGSPVNAIKRSCLHMHYHLYMFKSLCASRGDYVENLGETNVLACKMFTSGCRPWLKNVKLPIISCELPARRLSVKEPVSGFG